MGWIRCIRCEKLQHDFVARTFVLIHQFNMFCTNFHALTKRSQMHPNTTNCTETFVRVQWGGLGAFVAKNPDVTSWHECSSHFAPSFMQLRNDPKCTQTLCNAPKHEFRVQLGGLGKFVAKNPDLTSWHELLY